VRVAIVRGARVTRTNVFDSPVESRSWFYVELRWFTAARATLARFPHTLVIAIGKSLPLNFPVDRSRKIIDDVNIGGIDLRR